MSFEPSDDLRKRGTLAIERSGISYPTSHPVGSPLLPPLKISDLQPRDEPHTHRPIVGETLIADDHIRAIRPRHTSEMDPGCRSEHRNKDSCDDPQYPLFITEQGDDGRDRGQQNASGHGTPLLLSHSEQQNRSVGHDCLIAPAITVPDCPISQSPSSAHMGAQGGHETGTFVPSRATAIASRSARSSASARLAVIQRRVGGVSGRPAGSDSIPP